MTTKYFNDAIMGIASIINGMGNDYLNNQISWNFFRSAIEREIEHLDDLIVMIKKEDMNERDYVMYTNFRMVQIKLENMLKYKRVSKIRTDAFCL